MNNAYVVLKESQQKEINAFPLKFAFSQKQFEEGMIELGLEPDDIDKITGIGVGGGFCLRTDYHKLAELLDRHKKELNDAISNDSTGKGFIFDMFYHELANHEYCVTFDEEPALDALGLTWGDIDADERLSHGLYLAKKTQSDQVV